MKVMNHTKVKSWPILIISSIVCSFFLAVFKNNEGLIEFIGVSGAIISVVFATLHAFEQEEDQ